MNFSIKFFNLQFDFDILSDVSNKNKTLIKFFIISFF